MDQRGKNTLSGLLFFSSLWFYLDFARFRGNNGKLATSDKFPPLAALGISFALFLAAMLSKTTACVFARTFLIILWWKHRLDIIENVLRSRSPILCASAALRWLPSSLKPPPTAMCRQSGRSTMNPPLQRLLIASRGVWFYAIKTIFPYQLTFNYPRCAAAAAWRRHSFC